MQTVLWNCNGAFVVNTSEVLTEIGCVSRLVLFDTIQPVIVFCIVNFIYVIYLVSFILGIIGVRKKGCKRSLAIYAIILSGLILLIAITSYILPLIEILIR